MTTVPMNSFMTSKQLAEFLGVSERRVRKMAAERMIGRKFGHIWTFTQDECEQLLRDRKASKDWRVKK